MMMVIKFFFKHQQISAPHIRLQESKFKKSSTQRFVVQHYMPMIRHIGYQRRGLDNKNSVLKQYKYPTSQNVSLGEVANLILSKEPENH